MSGREANRQFGIVRRPTPKFKRELRAMLLCDRPWVECHWCGCRLTDSQITIDHIIPRSQFGKNHISNIIPACLPCNARRADTPYHAFAKKVAA